MVCRRTVGLAVARCEQRVVWFLLHAVELWSIKINVVLTCPEVRIYHGVPETLSLGSSYDRTARVIKMFSKPIDM